MDFAKDVYGEDAARNPRYAATIPSESRVPADNTRTWTLKTMQKPRASVIELLLDVYFQRSHWYILIFHGPSFRKHVATVWLKDSWTSQERGVVMAALMAAAVGLQVATNDSTWTGRSLLESLGLSCDILLDQLVTEVREHLLDVLDDCQIETVQVCILLGTFYIYHGSPNLAWFVIGMGIRAGYALGLHSEQTPSTDPSITQVRRRCWNHLKVADTFASMIYGRPASLDPAFASMQSPSELDDTAVPASTTFTNEIEREHPISLLTFHALKYRIYEIIADAVSRFRLLHIRRSSSQDDWLTLLRTINNIQGRLEDWYREVPPMLRIDHWPDQQFSVDRANESQEVQTRRIFHLQAIILQILYDSTLILIRRPVLESGLSTLKASRSGQTLNEPLSTSLDISVAAALRISAIPMEPLRNEMCVSFTLIHFFTSGVILCIPPSIKPFSSIAQECKRGVMRIIKASKSLRKHSHIAGLTEKLLCDLFRVTLQRELDTALSDDKLDETTQERILAASTSATPRGAVLLEQLQSSSSNQPMQSEHESEAPMANRDAWPTQLNTVVQESEMRNMTALDFDANFGSVYFNDAYEYANAGDVMNDHFQSAFGAFGQGNVSANAPMCRDAKVHSHVQSRHRQL